MKLNIAQVLGLNTDQKAAQVISSIQDADNAFFALVDLACDDAFTKGRSALSELSDFYFESEGSASEKLIATYEEARKKFLDVEFSLLLASVSGKVLYLIGKGEVEVYLKRGDKISSLLTTQDQLVSGFLQGADKLLIASKNLTSTESSSKEILDLSYENFEQEILDRTAGSDLEGGMAGLLIEVEEPEEAPIEEALGIEEKIATNEQILSKVKFDPQVILDKVISALGRIFFGIKHYFPKSNRSRLILAVILLILIAGGAGLKYKSSREEQRQVKFNQILQEAKNDLEAARGLSTLNPAEAKIKLDAAKAKVLEALKIKPTDSEAQGFKSSLEQESTSILKLASVADFPLFLDLDLVKKNLRPNKMTLSAGKVLLLDEAVETLVVVDLEKKSNEILAGSEQLGDAEFASLNGEMAFVYSKDKGLLRVDTGNKKLTTVSKSDKEWGEIKDLYGFASNIYVLDSINNQIWKYLPTTDGYSDKRKYLTTAADLTNGIRMQIESSIYVLKQGGEILRFTKGEKDNFGLEGLDKGVNNPKSFFVSSDTDNLYLLDSGNSRLLVLTKTGSYKEQYSGEKFAQASDLVVDETAKKVYLLEGGKIYTVDLR